MAAYGGALLGRAWQFEARQAGPGMARRGWARRGEALQAMLGCTGPGRVRLGKAGMARQGAARRGSTWYGVAWQAWLFAVWRFGARHGDERHRRRGVARLGVARLGGAWRGHAGRARRGMAGPGQAGQGKAGNFNTINMEDHRVTVFVFRSGLNFPVNPNVAGKELERIRQKYKQLAPRHVVAEAAPADAPLHPVFEWDDAKAANSYRESMARNLIRSVQIVREGSEREPMYVHVQRDKREDNSYEPASVVVRNPDMFAIAFGELRENMFATADSAIKLLSMSQRAADKQRSRAVMNAKVAIDEARAAVEAIP